MSEIIANWFEEKPHAIAMWVLDNMDRHREGCTNSKAVLVSPYGWWNVEYGGPWDDKEKKIDWTPARNPLYNDEDAWHLLENIPTEWVVEFTHDLESLLGQKNLDIKRVLVDTVLRMIDKS